MMYDIESQIDKLQMLLQMLAIDYDRSILEYELENAREFINNRRQHTPTEAVPLEAKYYGVQIRLAKSAILRYGTEGQSSHNELGIAEIYESGSAYSSRDINSIIPKARVLRANTSE